MAEVLFYHLERSTVEQVLPGLLEKTRQRDWRAVVRAPDEPTAEALDAHLWTFADESFLPHGREARAGHPIVVTETAETDGADVLFLLAGAPADAASFAEFTRTVVLFDEAGAPQARTLWKDVKALEKSIEATYWRQSANGRWEKAA